MATEQAPTQVHNTHTAAKHIADHFDSLLGDPEEAKATPKVTEHEPETPQESEATTDADDQEDVKAEATEAESTDDDEEEGVDLNLENLARHLGMEVEDLLDGFQLPVKVNGEESHKALRDVVKSYQLESAINQKSMKLSDELKQTEREREEIKRERELYQQKLAPYLQELHNLVQQDDEVDWERLSEENPQAYLKEKARADARKHELERSQQQYQYLEAQRLQDHLQKESQKLPDLIPEWSEPEVRQTETRELTEYMRKSGYSDQDIQSISYGKAEWIATIRKAMLFDKAKNNVETKKKVKAAPKLKVKPGVTQSKKDAKRDKIKPKYDRLRKSGKTQDAADLLYDLLDD